MVTLLLLVAAFMYAVTTSNLCESTGFFVFLTRDPIETVGKIGGVRIRETDKKAS